MGGDPLKIPHGDVLTSHGGPFLHQVSHNQTFAMVVRFERISSVSVFILLTLSVLIELKESLGVPSATEVVVEVPKGETGMLSCTSNDEDHIFAFWELAGAENNSRGVIGPGNNNYDRRKYNYEVLSGTLTIKVQIIVVRISFYICTSISGACLPLIESLMTVINKTKEFWWS